MKHQILINWCSSQLSRKECTMGTAYVPHTVPTLFPFPSHFLVSKFRVASGTEIGIFREIYEDNDSRSQGKGTTKEISGNIITNSIQNRLRALKEITTISTYQL